MRECPCGSGRPSEDIYDGHGIYLCRVCDECRAERLSHYREDIFEHYEADEPIDED